jgi:hypothetical protein
LRSRFGAKAQPCTTLRDSKLSDDLATDELRTLLLVVAEIEGDRLPPQVQRFKELQAKLRRMVGEDAPAADVGKKKPRR